MHVISVRVTDEEKQILDEAQKIYNCGTSTLLKRITFQKLEDDFDLKIIKDYQKNKKQNKLDLIEIEDVWKALNI